MERTKEETPVAVPADVLEGLESVRLSGKTNMLDAPRVIELALQMGHVETAMWVYDSRKAYATGIFAGFAAEVIATSRDSSHHVAEPAACGSDAEQSDDAGEPIDTFQGGR